MAYQQQGGLANGPGGSGEHHGPQGTEYTLQGECEEAVYAWTMPIQWLSLRMESTY